MECFFSLGTISNCALITLLPTLVMKICVIQNVSSAYRTLYSRKFHNTFLARKAGNREMNRFIIQKRLPTRLSALETSYRVDTEFGVIEPSDNGNATY